MENKYVVLLVVASILCTFILTSTFLDRDEVEVEESVPFKTFIVNVVGENGNTINKFKAYISSSDWAFFEEEPKETSNGEVTFPIHTDRKKITVISGERIGSKIVKSDEIEENQVIDVTVNNQPSNNYETYWKKYLYPLKEEGYFNFNVEGDPVIYATPPSDDCYISIKIENMVARTVAVHAEIKFEEYGWIETRRIYDWDNFIELVKENRELPQSGDNITMTVENRRWP